MTWKRQKNCKKKNFLIVGISRRQIGVSCRENRSEGFSVFAFHSRAARWWRSSRFSREISFHSKWSRNLRKRLGKSFFAPRSLADLLPYKISFPFFGSRERFIHSRVLLFREIQSLFKKIMNRHLRSIVNARNSSLPIRTRNFPGVTSSLAARFATMYSFLFMVFSFSSMSMC